MAENILSDDKILEIRNAVDAISWTLLDISKVKEDRLLRLRGVE